MADQEDIYVLGAGGHAKVVISTLRAARFGIRAILDDNLQINGGEVLGIPVAGPLSLLEEMKFCRAVIAIGNNRARREIAERFRHVEWVTAVHPQTTIDPTVTLGAGTVIFAGTVIQPCTRIGRHVIVNTGATIDHDCFIGDYAHVAPGCHLAGNVTLGEGVLIGIAGAALPKTTVGAWTVVGAGGIVTTDLPPHIIATGIPAKPRTR